MVPTRAGVMDYTSEFCIAEQTNRETEKKGNTRMSAFANAMHGFDYSQS